MESDGEVAEGRTRGVVPRVYNGETSLKSSSFKVKRKKREETTRVRYARDSVVSWFAFPVTVGTRR